MIILLALACVEPGATDLSDWTEGYPDEDIVVEEPELFQLINVTDLGYPTRLGEVDAGESCGVEMDGTTDGYVDIECRLDISELDLYGSGMAFDLYVPAGACEYLVYYHPQFEAWEVGDGPSAVSYQVDPAGNIYDEVNSVGGTPYCEYDYSWGNDDHPNCCTGTYDLTVTKTDQQGNVTTTTSPPLGWGGQISDCYNGAGFDSPEAQFNAAGWPVPIIEPLYGAEFSKRFEWDRPSDDYYSNIVLASYFDPADHEGSGPEGMLAEYSIQQHTFLCYDHAEELLGKLEMDVREWNEQGEFLDIGDPDTTGTEPVTGLPLDDRDDWATGTPGTGTWIQSAL